jgi:hypothetical protein
MQKYDIFFKEKFFKLLDWYENGVISLFLESNNILYVDERMLIFYYFINNFFSKDRI